MQSVLPIIELHRELVRRWHDSEVDNPYDGWLFVVAENHRYNFLLWHEEDIARSPQASDAEIAAVKRNIDRYNQLRNNWIESIDEALQRQLEDAKVAPQPGARFNSETPGATIDRLSILALRLYHLNEQLERPDASAEHLARVSQKLAVAQQQHVDLKQALSELLEDLWAGHKRMRLYKQLKMYNDPTMNPYLYNAGQPALRRAG